MKLVNSTKESLVSVLLHQVGSVFPFRDKDHAKKIIDENIDDALLRLRVCINSVRMWRVDEFNYLHSSQYCIFLYYLANSIWKSGKDADCEICTRLFLLNKTLNGIDLFYEIEMPKKFFIAHSIGIVLAKAKYGEYLALHQGVTVGKNYGNTPEIGDAVSIFPNSAVLGLTTIGDNCIISQGCSIVNRTIPTNSAVFSGVAGRVTISDNLFPVTQDIFRLEE